VNAIRYLYLLQPDGIGTQYIYISRLLDYAARAGCRLIVDFRRMALFASSGGHCDEAELRQVLCFDTDRIIVNPAEIDRIVAEQKHAVAGVIFYQTPQDQTKGIPFRIVRAEDLLPADSDQAACSLQNKLQLMGGYRQAFDNYRPIVSSCIGVHGRFGNGEFEQGGSIQPEMGRMKTPWARFFAALDGAPDDKFFVCTDTPSFLQACRDRYGSRVVHYDRYMPPENCGPGHNLWSIHDEEKRAGYIEERNRVGPYRLLGEALIEMSLLGECRRLVCSRSSFTHYARVCCSVDAIVLE
jgi:hypothetical protein